MITRSSVTFFSKPYARHKRNGDEYERQEAYGPLATLKSAIEAAEAAGQTMVQLVSRPYEKEKQARVAIEVRFFTGNGKKETKQV